MVRLSPCLPARPLTWCLLWMALIACKKDDASKGPSPIADFTVAGANCPAICEVSFDNTSANSTMYTWDFGDGSPALASISSTVRHLYQKAGTYTVTLTAGNPSGTTSSKSVSVTITSHTPRNQLIDRPYLATDSELKQNGQLQSQWSFLAPCYQDNILTFLADGTYRFTDAGVVCSPAVSMGGTWTLSADNTRLTLTGANNLSRTYTILQLDPAVLKLSYQESAIKEFIYTYTPQ